MKLRNHPFLSHHGVRSWPPTWLSLEGGEKQTLKGEIGILREVRMSRMMGGFNKCFLVINYEGSAYIGTLFVDSLVFCVQMVKLMRDHCGESLTEIGNLDLSYTL